MYITLDDLRLLNQRIHIGTSNEKATSSNDMRKKTGANPLSNRLLSPQAKQLRDFSNRHERVSHGEHDTTLTSLERVVFWVRTCRGMLRERGRLHSGEAIHLSNVSLDASFGMEARD